MKKSLKKNKKGFTLVEMIVVIAIIGVLAAMMVPSLLGFVDKANTSNNNSTAAGVGRAVQAILTEYTSSNKTVDIANYTGQTAASGTQIQLSTTGLTGDTLAFVNEINTLISQDKFPTDSGLSITIAADNELTGVVFTKKVASGGSPTTATGTTPSKDHGVFLP